MAAPQPEAKPITRALARDDAVAAAALGLCLIALGRPREALGPLKQALAIASRRAPGRA